MHLLLLLLCHDTLCLLSLLRLLLCLLCLQKMLCSSGIYVCLQLSSTPTACFHISHNALQWCIALELLQLVQGGYHVSFEVQVHSPVASGEDFQLSCLEVVLPDVDLRWGVGASSSSLVAGVVQVA